MIRPATADDSAAIETIVQAAYAPYIERIGRKPGPMQEDYPQLVEDGGVHVLDHAGQGARFGAALRDCWVRWCAGAGK